MKRKSLFLIAAVSAVAVPSLGSAQVPRSWQDTPGKEYTDRPDKDSTGAADPCRDLRWLGGGLVVNSIKFDVEGNVDAMANIGDALFSSVASESAVMIFSTVRDGRAPVLYEMPVSGANGIWATAADIDANGVNDLDALEVWGPPDADDATQYSLEFDPGGVAVWDELGAVDAPYISTAEIAAAIGAPAGLAIDLDALMLNGDQMIFSVRANGFYDGGEIWTYTRGGGPGTAAFLFHGGHLWNTAFDVMGTFGTATEDIDAIEAVDVVPEPATLAALGLGALALLRRKNRLA